MAITGKSLASGQLATSKATLYTVPASTVAYVKFLRICNDGSTTPQLVTIYAKQSGGSSVTIAKLELQTNEMAEIIDKDCALTLSTGDTIEGFTTTSNAVSYFISGAEDI